MTFGGAKRAIRLAMAKPTASPAAAEHSRRAPVAFGGALQEERHAASGAKGGDMFAVAQEGFRLGQDRHVWTDIGEASAAAARRSEPS